MTLQEPENPIFCTFCDRRAAKPAVGPPFCLRCIHDSAKRRSESELPDDPYLRGCVVQLLGVR